MARARTMATRCCWPPDSRSGYCVGLVGQAEALQQRACLLLGLGARPAQRLPRRERDVAKHAHVREEVVGLEDDADVAAHAVEVHAASA